MAKEVTMGTIPVISVDKSVSLLSTMYSNVIKSGVGINKIPSVMLWSSPGVGKSQSIREVATKIEAATNKRVNITDVRLILFNPVDLRGIPTSNADKTLAIWLKPKIFDMDPSNDVINILFLDEISAASPSVQAAAYQITLDRTIGEHKLPDNCIVIAAGNRVTDKSVAYQMPKALANRLLHLEIEANFDSWNRWAIQSNINPMVLGFLKFKPDYLNAFDPSSASLAFATPRAWEMVSNILNYVSDDINSVFDLVSGIIGTGIAVELKGFIKIYKGLPNIADIFAGKEVTIPKNTDVLFALSGAMIAYAKLKEDDDVAITNSIEYITKLPPDYSFVILRDYLLISDSFKLKLLNNSAYSRWLKTKGRIIDAAYR